MAPAAVLAATVRGYTLQFARGTGVVNEAITSADAGLLPWGKDHHRVYRDLLYKRLQIGIACEDLPEEHNRVTLDPVLNAAGQHAVADGITALETRLKVKAPDRLEGALARAK